MSAPSPAPAPRWVTAATTRGGATVLDGMLHVPHPVGFAAAFTLPTATEPRLTAEFGLTVYGPFRATIEDARADLRDLVLTFASDETEFRKEVAIKGAERGTASRLPVTDREPLLKRVTQLHAPAAPAGSTAPQTLRIYGSRRSFVSAEIAAQTEAPPALGLLRRGLDFFADLLGACVDVGFGLLPQFTEAVVPGLQEVFKEEAGETLDGLLPVLQTIYAQLAQTEVFAGLQPPRSARDAAAIAGFVKQLAQRAHASDSASKKAASKAKSRLSKLKNTKTKSLVVYNVSKTADETQLQEVLGGPSAVRTLVLARTPENKFKGFAYVVMRNKQLAEQLLALTPPPMLCGRMLKVARYGVKPELADVLRGWGASPPTHSVDEPEIRQDAGQDEATDQFAAGKRISVPFQEGPLFSLPVALAEQIKRIVSDNPNCNIGVIKQRVGAELDPAKYGFKNLVHMLASLPDLQVSKIYGKDPSKVAYTATTR